MQFVYSLLLGRCPHEDFYQPLWEIIRFYVYSGKIKMRGSEQLQ